MKRWAAMLLFVLAPACGMAAPAWVTTWMAVPDTAGPAMPALSLRQALRTSVGGDSVRVRLSNELGTTPLVVGAVRVARSAGGAAIERARRDRIGKDHLDFVDRARRRRRHVHAPALTATIDAGEKGREIRIGRNGREPEIEREADDCRRHPRGHVQARLLTQVPTLTHQPTPRNA